MKHLTDKIIQMYLEGRNPEQNDFIEKHLKICKKCKDAVANYKLIFSGLKSDIGFDLPDNFTKQVISKIKAAETSKSRIKSYWMFLLFFGIFAISCSALLFIDVGTKVSDFFSGLKLETGFLETSRNAINNLDLNIGLLLGAGLVLLFIAIIDNLISHPKYK